MPLCVPMAGHDLPTYPALPTRWEFRGAGVAFRLWTRPVLERGRLTAVTLTWRHADGTAGRRGCGGLVEATEHAARVAAMAEAGVVLTG